MKLEHLWNYHPLHILIDSALQELIDMSMGPGSYGK